MLRAPGGIKLPQASGGLARHFVERRVKDAGIDARQAERKPAYRLPALAEALVAAVQRQQVARDRLLPVELCRQGHFSDLCA